VIEVKPLKVQPTEEDVQVKTEIKLPARAGEGRLQHGQEQRVEGLRRRRRWREHGHYYRNTFTEEVRRAA